MKLLVVEDHPIFRDGLIAALAPVPSLEITGTPASVAESLAELEREPPDLALIDLSLTDGSGLDVVRAASARGVKVLVLTMSHDPLDLVESVRAGARGYVVKGAGRADIVSAIEAVAQGDVLFGSDVADLALQAVSRQDARSAAFPTLTERELDVLGLLGVGLPNAMIAARLHLSDKTVRNHVSAILAKLDVATRHEAAELARARLS